MAFGRHTSKFWKPFALYCLLTPLCLLIGIASGGAGHGNYILAKLLFPFTMFSTIFFGSITEPFITLALIQYPAYGVISGFANRKNRLLLASAIVFTIHGVMAVVCLVVPDQN